MCPGNPQLPCPALHAGLQSLWCGAWPWGEPTGEWDGQRTGSPNRGLEVNLYSPGPASIYVSLDSYVRKDGHVHG